MLSSTPSDVVNTILYLTRTGCAWRMLPRVCPFWQTVERVRAPGGKARSSGPSAGIIDSRSLKGADTVGCDSCGYDAGKKDQWSYMLRASVQGRDGARPTRNTRSDGQVGDARPRPPTRARAPRCQKCSPLEHF
ncbi:MAG: transposase [Solirubrobacteraceae bacterium]